MILGLTLEQSPPYPQKIDNSAPFLLIWAPTILIFIIFTNGYKGLVITSLTIPRAPATTDSFESAMEAKKRIILSDLTIRDRVGFPGTPEFEQTHKYNQTTSQFVSDLCRRNYCNEPTQDDILKVLMYIPIEHERKFDITVDFVKENYKLNDECNGTRKFRGSKIENYILKNLNLDYKVGMDRGQNRLLECDGSLLALTQNMRYGVYNWVRFACFHVT